MLKKLTYNCHHHNQENSAYLYLSVYLKLSHIVNIQWIAYVI